MPSQRNVILVLSSAGMMLSVSYGCAAFIFACFNLQPVALSLMAIVLAIAVLTTLSTPRERRRFIAIGFQLLAFWLAFLYQCHDYYRIETPCWNMRWVPEFLFHKRIAADWALLFLTSLCTCILWLCGRRLITQPPDQITVSNRFDAGLGFFLFLLLIKLAMASKGVALSETPSVTRFIIAFFILGLFSMGMARSKDAYQEDDFRHLKGAGIALTFALTLLFLGGGFLLLFLPEFKTFAETGAGLIKGIARPLQPFIIAALRLLFGRASWDQAPQGSGAADAPTIPQANAGDGAFAFLTPFLAIGLMLAILLLCGIVLYRIFNWLWSKPSNGKKQKRWRLLLLSFITAVRKLLLYLRQIMPGKKYGPYQAENYYHSLIAWGRYSGLGQSISETPQEYAARLGRHFPQVDNEIRVIVQLHDEAIYGCKPTDRNQTARAKTALKRLRTPLLWLTRLKTLCFHHHP